MGIQDGYAPGIDTTTPQGVVELARAEQNIVDQFDEMDAWRALDPEWFDAALAAEAAEMDAWKDAHPGFTGTPPELAAIIDRHETAIREHFTTLT
jgi:hypothetical protein